MKPVKSEPHTFTQRQGVDVKTNVDKIGLFCFSQRNTSGDMLLLLRKSHFLKQECVLLFECLLKIITRQDKTYQMCKDKIVQRQ